METNINYYKYLKYKSKYIELKKTLSGGDSFRCKMNSRKCIGCSCNTCAPGKNKCANCLKNCRNKGGAH